MSTAAPTPDRGRVGRWLDARPALKGVAAYAATAVVALAVGALSAYLGIPVPPPPPPPVPVQMAGDLPAGEPIQTFGWVPDPEAVLRVVAAQAVPDFADTPAGRVVRGDEDVFLWRAVRKAAGKPDTWYPNVNQRDVGCCVGCGYKHAVDVLQAVRITQGAPAEWRPVSVEAIYGASRVEVGGGRISGDGSVGAWAFDAVRRVGNLEMTAHPGHDLTEFSPARARQWGRGGVPDALEPTANKSVVRAGAKVTTWADVKRAVGQGYPVPVCSMQGFTMTRDADGFARPQGTWPHCMLICGLRTAPREGAFILNSWGDIAHTGPRWPADMPAAGFWADPRTVERMVAEGDSFALSDVTGFPARALDWRIRHRPHRNDLFALAR